jgi:4-aminobutyrate aminotransferase-like enzyme
MAPTSTRKTLDLLARYESRNVTFLDPDAGWPVVWKKSRGCQVWDIEGRRYLDLTAAFGVCATGHGNPRVVRAGQKQMATLVHAMGDVHPHPLKALLARELSRITFERWTRKANRTGNHKSSRATGKTIFCNSGFEAVESALKTALLATGSPGVLAFEGAYHGLGYGALSATHRDHFRAPFRSQLKSFGRFAPFPKTEGDLKKTEEEIRRALEKHPIGAVLVEPVQGRGGIHIPPPGFLPMLRRVCDAHRALLILDEVLTGFGRTGTWFACEHFETVPDLICLGKALTGGFPLSACVGRAELMDRAWPASNGEAIHTSTFLGHPVGCAMALAQIKELRDGRLPGRSARIGKTLLAGLKGLTPPGHCKLQARGIGLMAGLEITEPDGAPATATAIKIMQKMLQRGILLLPEGEHGNILSFTPPLIITEAELDRALNTLQKLFAEYSDHRRNR